MKELSANDAFEVLGSLYHRRFHRLRPGKDEPMASGLSSLDETNVNQFNEWIKHQALNDALARIDELEQEVRDNFNAGATQAKFRRFYYEGLLSVLRETREALDGSPED